MIKMGSGKCIGVHSICCIFCWPILFVWYTEHGDLKTKTEALKKVIQLMLNGEKMQSLLMTVIRFVMPLQDHMLKKMLLVFWEVVPKYTSDGKMLHEMILVCDAYRKVSILNLYCLNSFCWVPAVQWLF